MIEKEIEELKRKLDLLIEKGASKEEVYDMSVRIDKKIMEYYSIYELGDITK
ncbi:MAG: Spo0E family sporulation regulatory protein-aspartic acid phosphatase [Clostridia bacterium]|nr:Spo0E family sporulation regulatory protein-aspartic acid phosphatase [Clostridia bacterium]